VDLGGRRDSQANRIARALVDRIREGVYAVGAKLPSERKLAEEFAVSRPVVREALSTLTAMDLVDIQMGRGAFVIAAPGDHVVSGGVKLQDVVNVREVLEIGALRLAVTHVGGEEHAAVGAALERLREKVTLRQDTVEADRALHAAIILAARSPLLASLWEGIDKQVVETIRISPHGQTMSKAIFELHEKLARDLVAGKLESAIEASKLLHEDNRRFLRELLA
jgi:GntR family transcriptional regulator, transcriptional repressor for pyruvate dehydrogenase complex